MLAVNEVFETLQGEATLTGTPAVFIRLQGCGVGCPWCDTKHTWATDPERTIGLGAMLQKVEAAPTFAMCSPEDLARVLRERFTARHVVLTGGEPCEQDLRPLTQAILRQGRTVQIETSGTVPIRADARAWITLSPKLAMPGGRQVRPDAVALADEIKMPVGKPEDVERLLGFLREHGQPRPQGGVWVQPLSRSAKATALCIDAAREHGWRVSVQVHSYIGVR